MEGYRSGHGQVAHRGRRTRLSKSQLCSEAELFRSWCGAGAGRIDLEGLLRGGSLSELGWTWQVNGALRGGMLAQAVAGRDGGVIIMLSRGTWSSLVRGLVRSRFTVAHEIGHALLHSDYLRDGESFLDRVDVDVREYDLEREANVFAGALLIPEGALNNGMCAAELAHVFGTSEETASIRLKDFRKG